MNDKQKQARFAMLKQLSSKKSSEMNEPKAGALKAKFSSKFKSEDKEEEPKAKKLTKGQEILKAKLGKLFDEENEDEDEAEEEDCEECHDEGCALCLEDEADDEDE